MINLNCVTFIKKYQIKSCHCRNSGIKEGVYSQYKKIYSNVKDRMNH